jgi:hypothetical protein
MNLGPLGYTQSNIFYVLDKGGKGNFEGGDGYKLKNSLLRNLAH